ncbi:hypothetical protein ACU4GD_34380 [Cupriavidus basilensis]
MADTGVDTSMLVALTMKAAYLHRNVTLVQLAETLRLPASVLNEIATLAVRERMMEVAHRGANDLDVRFRLTEGGYGAPRDSQRAAAMWAPPRSPLMPISKRCSSIRSAAPASPRPTSPRRWAT